MLLLAKVRHLSKTAYQSLPWGFRVSSLMTRLAFGLTDTVGRVFYALFLDQGVEGLPPGGVAGTPPERLPPTVAAAAKRFGDKLYSKLIVKTRNPDLAESVLGEMLVSVVKGRFVMKPGVSLREAENYVFKAVMRHLVDYLRKHEYDSRSDSIRNPGGVNLEDVNLDDPKTFRDLDEWLTRSDLDKILREIKRIDSRAPAWLAAQLEGKTNRELAEDWGVSAPRITQWEQQYLPRIQEVVKEYIRAAA